MKLLNFRNSFLKISLLFLINLQAYAYPSFNSELGSGDSSLYDIEATKAFAYNPAILADHRGFSLRPFFFEYNENKAGHSTLLKVRTFKHFSTAEKITTVADLVGKPLHFDFKLGSAAAYYNFAFAFFPSLNFDSIQRGAAIPILEVDASARLNSNFTYAHRIYKYFSLGTNLRPTYKIQYRFEKNPIEILNNPKAINPLTNSDRGWGLGVDLGLTFDYELPQDQWVSLSTVIENLGVLSYSNSRNKRYEKPSPEYVLYKFGSTYKKVLPIPILNAIKVHYAYVNDQSPFYELVYPHRFGMTLETFGSHLNLSLGSFRGKPCTGFTLKFNFLEFSYVNYYDVSLNIARTVPDRRQGFALSLIF